MVSEVNTPGLGGGQASPKRCAETDTRGRLNTYLWSRRSGATCGNGGPHCGYRIQPIRMRPEVQLLPGPPLALISANAG